MAFALYDEDGYIQNVGTISGYALMAGFVERISSDNVSSPLTDLFEHGYTVDTEDAAEEAGMIMGLVQDGDIRHTLSDLKEGLSKAKGIAIISEA
jgi:hypothetical protein